MLMQKVRKNKDIWTQEAIEEYGEILQRVMKEWNKEVPIYIDRTVWQCRQNQRMVKAKLEAKKAREEKAHLFPSFLQCYNYQAGSMDIKLQCLKCPLKLVAEAKMWVLLKECYLINNLSSCASLYPGSLCFNPSLSGCLLVPLFPMPRGVPLAGQ